MAEQVALITGITGQDGALLAELLLAKGTIVHGLVRRSSRINLARLTHLLDVPAWTGRLHLHAGDMTDGGSIVNLLHEIQPHEIYNLAAQSDVAISFEAPEHTANVDALGPLRVLESVRRLGMAKDVRFYQASTSEMFGSAPGPQHEKTPFQPRSPYAIAKVYAYWTTVHYREAHGVHASNGILFNHEGPTRGEAFVTRKITRAVAAIEAGQQEKLFLGNLDALRDWGHARDYVEGMWRMLQQTEPDDYVLATGELRTVREFVDAAFREIGVEIAWRGTGIDSRGVDRRTGRLLVEVDPRFFRPLDVNMLRGDARRRWSVSAGVRRRISRRWYPKWSPPTAAAWRTKVALARWSKLVRRSTIGESSKTESSRPHRGKPRTAPCPTIPRLDDPTANMSKKCKSPGTLSIA